MKKVLFILITILWVTSAQASDLATAIIGGAQEGAKLSRNLQESQLLEQEIELKRQQAIQLQLQNIERMRRMRELEEQKR